MLDGVYDPGKEDRGIAGGNDKNEGAIQQKVHAFVWGAAEPQSIISVYAAPVKPSSSIETVAAWSAFERKIPSAAVSGEKSAAFG